MIAKLKEYDYLLILICVYLARIIVFHPSFADSIIFIAAMGYLSYLKYLKQIKANRLNEEVMAKLAAMEAVVVETRSTMSAIKCLEV